GETSTNPLRVAALVPPVDRDRAALRPRPLGGQRDGEGGTGFFERTRARRAGADGPDEGGQFLAVGGPEAIPEVAIRGRGRAGGGRLHRTDPTASVVPDHDAVAGAEDLEPDVIAERIATRPGDDHQPAARQMQDGCADVDVVELLHPGSVEAGAVRVDLGDLFT